MKGVWVALALVLVPALSAGYHNPPAPLRDQVSSSAGFAVAWRLAVQPGSYVSVEPDNAANGAETAAFGIWELTSNMTFRSSFLGGGLAYDGTVVHVETGETGEVVERRQGSGMRTRWAYTIRPTVAQEIVLVVALAADGPSTSDVRLWHDAGVTILGRSIATAVVLAEEHFSGGTSAHVRVGREYYFGAGPDIYADARARFVEGASHEVHPTGRLFGYFWGITNSGDLAMGVDTPSGPRDGAQLYRFSGEPAGTYRLRIDRNLDAHEDRAGICEFVWGIGRCWFPRVWSLVADVAPPPG